MFPMQVHTTTPHMSEIFCILHERMLLKRGFTACGQWPLGMENGHMFFTSGPKLLPETCFLWASIISKT